METYSIRLNGVMLVDKPIGLDDLEFSVLRDDGFSSGDSILRYRVTSELTFWGCGYAELCKIKKEGLCENVEVIIYENSCETESIVFTGTIPISWVKFNHTVKTANSQIRDNAFSAFVKDFIKTEVNLWSAKTKNCLPITGIDKNIDFSKIHNSAGSAKEVLCFDVIAVLNYIIKYITDNKMSVVSNYYSTPTSVFGSNLYAITTGFNLRNVSSQGDIEAIYPTLSFEKVFKELRKKHRVFMDVVGDTIYIEREPEMFDNTNVLTIDKIPHGLIESVDSTRLFNGFKIGSSNTKPQDNAHTYYQASKLDMWATYNISSCGDCTATNDSETANIDIVSDFIIDSNMIHEQLNTSDTGNDKSVYLVNYFEENGVTEAMREYIGGEWVYNTAITNQKVIDNWIGFSPQCLAVKRYSDLFFLVRTELFQISVYPLNWMAVVDNGNIITDITQNAYTSPTPMNIGINLPSGSGTVSTLVTYYECPINTNINLKAFWNDIKLTSGSSPNSVDFKILIHHYSDNTLSTVLNVYQNTLTVPNIASLINSPESMDCETGMIFVNAGECFAVVYYVDLNFIPIVSVDFTGNTAFRLIDADGMCDTRNDDNFDSKANLYEFEKHICKTDFDAIKANKRGYVLLNGIKAWIKEVKYTKKKTTFRLVSNNTLCRC